MEFYNYYESEDYDCKLLDNNNINWGYFSKKKMRQLYPDNDFFIVGEVYKQKNLCSDQYILYKEHKLTLQLPKTQNTFLYKTCGYMQCSREQVGDIKQSVAFVAVKESRFPKHLVLSFLLLICILGSFLWYIHQKQETPFEEAAIAYKMPTGVAKSDDPNSISIPGYGTLTMEKDKQEIYVALLNPEGNPCNFRYQIILKESGETLYQTKLIKPGMAITTAKIDKELAIGTYAITLLIETTSLEDHKQALNAGAIETTLVVK